MIKKLILLLCFFASTHGAEKPSGIINQGNTCYMNATLQCLYNIQPLSDFILSKKNSNFYVQTDLIKGSDKVEKEVKSVAYEYTNLVDKLQKNLSSPVDPITFCERMWPVMGSRAMQEDADEFLTKLLDHLIDADIDRFPTTQYYGFPFSDKPRGLPGTLFWITEGSVTTLIQSKPTIPLSKRLGSLANRLSLEIKGDSLISCLDQYFSPEILQATDESNSPKFSKKLELIKLPPYFIMTLKRFNFSGIGAEKITTPIKMPLNNLELKPYLASDSIETDTTYELVSLVQHAGSFNGGHYTAYIKHKNKWFFCDDSSTTEFDKPENFQSIGKSSVDSSFTPYILFYKKNSKVGSGNKEISTSEFPPIINKEELLNYLELNKINDNMLKIFLNSSRPPITIESLVQGINDRFITRNTVIGYVKDKLKDMGIPPLLPKFDIDGYLSLKNNLYLLSNLSK